jgi:hypothetical protein
MDNPTATKQNNLINITASCSAAISFLETIEREDGIPELQPLQIENARYSLAAKLSQLEMYDSSFKELRSLKRRLEAIMRQSMEKESWLVETEEMPTKLSKPKTKANPKSTEDPKKSNLNGELNPDDVSSLLEFANVTPSSFAFPLVIAYQMGVLRCILGFKKPNLLEVRDIEAYDRFTG